MDRNLIITFLSLTVAVVSMLAALRNTPWWTSFKFNRRQEITWDRFWESFTSKDFINNEIEDQFDIVIGVNDGIVPASIIVTNNYGAELYYCETSRSEKSELWEAKNVSGLENDTTKVYFPDNHVPSVDEKRILIVDDNYLTGTSMEAVYRYINQLGTPKSISCRALFQYQNADKPSRHLNFQAGEFVDPKYSHNKEKIDVFKAPWSLSETHQRRYNRGSSKGRSK